MQISIEENRTGVINKLMQILSEAANVSIKENNIFLIGVSGGSLATFLAEGLPNIKTDFSKWKIFFCDERVVSEDDKDSTFGFYLKNVIPKVAGLTEENFINIKQNLSVEETAEDYRKKLAMYFKGDALPRFDVLLLGMGPDGHTCSLFPGHKLLEETEKWIAPISDSPKPPPCRVTMTFPVINNAKNCIFAMCGKEKADMVKRILNDKEDLPSTRVNPTSGKLHWILDKEAGSQLKNC